MCKLQEKKLLEGLTGIGVDLNVRALARFTAENGVLVKVHCSRRRGNISLPPKMLGLRPDKWADHNKEFYDAHIALGRLTMIPREKEARLSQLEGQARTLLSRASLNDDYVPLAVLDELKESFGEIRTEYLAAIDDVAKDWAQIVEEFQSGVRRMVESRCKGKILKRDREKMIDQILGAVPSLSDYRSYADLRLECRAFPVTGVTAEGLAPDLQDALNATWKDDVVANAIKGIETGIGEIFVLCCKILSTYANTGKIHGRSINALSRAAVRAKKLNIFANPMLAQLADHLVVTECVSDDQMAECVEDQILDTFQYARSTGIKLDMSKCPISQEELEDMLEIRKKLEPAPLLEEGA